MDEHSAVLSIACCPCPGLVCKAQSVAAAAVEATEEISEFGVRDDEVRSHRPCPTPFIPDPSAAYKYSQNV